MDKRRFPSVFALLATAGLFASPVWTATPEELSDCNQTKDLSRAIAACSQAIRDDPQGSDSQLSWLLVKRGFAYFLKRDYDSAFVDYEEAIRRNPKEASAYAYRGILLQIRGDDEAAIADFSRAIDMNWTDAPGFPSARINRAKAYAYKGEMARAMKDYDAEIQKDPNDMFARLNRGVAYIYNGSPDKAILDLRRIAELHPRDPMFAIWLYIAERRAGKDSRLASSQLASKTAQFNMTRWPAPVVRLFIGEGTLPLQLSSKELASGLKCEADFYSAEFMVWQGKKAEAVRLYKSAQQECVRIWLEWGAATAALSSLDEKR